GADHAAGGLQSVRAPGHDRARDQLRGAHGAAVFLPDVRHGGDPGRVSRARPLAAADHPPGPRLSPVAGAFDRARRGMVSLGLYAAHWKIAMATRIRPSPERLYDEDFYVWTQVQADLLRRRQFEALDLDHLIEEVEALGRAEKNSVLNNAGVIIEHLLKLQHSPAKEPR